LSMDFIERPDEALRKFLSSKQRRVHAGYILRQITKQYTTDERISPLREDLKNNVDKVEELINELMIRTIEEQEFTASIIPTVVSADKARSMKMLKGEKPSELTATYWIYLQISGVLVGGNIVNLLYVDEAARLFFLDQLINKGALVLNKASIDKNELKKVLGRRFPLDREFCSAFAFLNYFAYWVKNNTQMPQQLQDKFEISKYLYKSWTLSEKTTLTVISMPAGKKKKRGLYFVPKVSSFLTRWYGDYWSSKDKYPPLGRFISSLYDPDRGDESGPLLNSFLYDLMLNNRVNGPLLSRLVTMRADNVLTPKKRGKGAETVDCAPYFLQNTGGTKRLSGVGQQYRGGADTISLNSSP